jgi:hypothetical protein
MRFLRFAALAAGFVLGLFGATFAGDIHTPTPV